MTRLADALAKADTLLLDFDGPICGVFAGYPVAEVTYALRTHLADHDITLPSKFDSNRDPLQVLRWVGRHHPERAAELDDALTQAELVAVQSATATEHGQAAIEAARQNDKKVGVVSNNASAAIKRYLASHGLDASVDVVVGRAYGEPARLKPDPYSVKLAVDKLGTTAADTVLVGDSAADMKAATLASVHCIGYAKSPAREPVLCEAGAEFVVHTMAELADALRAG